MKSEAQLLIDEADTQKFNPRSFRKEMIAQGIINDIKKIFEDKNK